MINGQSVKSMLESFQSKFLKGLGFGAGLGAGLLATHLFAAAAAMNVFSAGDVVSAAKINQNFAIAAPEGGIMAFYLTSCPEGWAPADGTNGTPDLRGVFIRGLDDVGTGAAGNDPSGVRSLGNLQGDIFQGHYHNLSDGNLMQLSLTTFMGTGASTGWWTVTVGPYATNPTNDGTNGPPRTGSETRPKNVALTYCMRKNS